MMTALIERIGRALCDHANALDAVSARSNGLRPVTLDYEDWSEEYDAQAEAVLASLTDQERAGLGADVTT